MSQLISRVPYHGCIVRLHMFLQTYWYHAHIHTATKIQVEGGAFGMLIVDEPTTVPSWARDVNNERLLQIVRPSASTVLGNGFAPETFDMDQGVLYRLRTGIVDAQARTNVIEFDAAGCNVFHMASDGITRSQWKLLNALEVHGGSRSDFAICCNSTAPVNVLFANRVAAAIQVNPTDFRCGTDSPAYVYQRPVMLDFPSDTQLPAGNYRDISMSAAQINGQCKCPKPFCVAVTTIKPQPQLVLVLEFSAWDEHNSMFTIEYNTVEEWTLKGTQSHPFHLVSASAKYCTALDNACVTTNLASNFWFSFVFDVDTALVPHEGRGTQRLRGLAR